MKYIILLILIFTTSIINAQYDVNNYVALHEKLQTLGANGEKNNENLEGSPYYENKFVPGNIIVGKNEISNMYLRYNVVRNEVEIKSQPEAEKVYILQKSDSVRYQLKDYSYVSNKLRTDDGRVIFGYLKRIFKSPNLTFYEKASSYISPAQKDETSYGRDRPAKIHLTSHYYLAFNNKPLKEVDIKERDFRKILGDKPGMEAYFKDHKIKDVEDVKAMLMYYDSQKS